MALMLSSGIEGDENRLSSVQQKSKIPVRLTRLNSDSGRRSSSKDETEENQRMLRDSEEKLQNKRPSQIPIVVGRKQSETDENKLTKRLAASITGKKPLGTDSGVNLRETQAARVNKTTPNPAVPVKSTNHKPVKELTPPTRQRTPAPLETKQASKEEKELAQLEKQNAEVVEELQLWIDDGDQKNKTLEDVIDKTNEENVKLLVHISVMKNELKSLEKKNDTLQTELETKRIDLKRLKATEHYNERELRNLKRDLKRKEQNLEEAEESLDNALMEKQELLDDVDYLESRFQDSQTSNEELNARVDELEKMVNASNDKFPVDALEAEASHFENCETKDDTSRVIDQLEEQLAIFENENARIISEKDKELLELSELADEKSRVIDQLEDQLATLRKENSTMTTELSTVSDKDKRLSELWEQVENLKNQNEIIQNELEQASRSSSETDVKIDNLKQELQHEKSEKEIFNTALELAVNNYVMNEKVHSIETRQLETQLAEMKRLRETQALKVVYLSISQTLTFLMNKEEICSDTGNKAQFVCLNYI
ncbi:hypothetical protein OS493_032007 [Desmophyllum pertusum]|uniref:Uncharacterized protein n=1 Tax=Desmophyllum pertusum TaxID=174260 RepID=A0A9X0CXA7_9CNID|nr:hypothetical protein OS493_032007 [Desmophyllum pertusum]